MPEICLLIAGKPSEDQSRSLNKTQIELNPITGKLTSVIHNRYDIPSKSLNIKQFLMNDIQLHYLILIYIYISSIFFLRCHT